MTVTHEGARVNATALQSRLFVGKVRHHRKVPRAHGFDHRFFCFGLDLDELSELSRRCWFFGYNRAALFSLHDRDYVVDGPGTIREKLACLLRRRGVTVELGRIVLVTSARFLGHAFNPVSFYYCHDPSGELALVVAEVNNTFGERHVYVLNERAHDIAGMAAHYRVPKAFYVSPFNDVEGDYDFRFADLAHHLQVEMRIFEGDQVLFYASLTGQPRPLDTPSVLWALTRLPFNPFLTLPRIHWEAALLYFRKNLPITIKPRPDHPDTVRAVPTTPLHRWAIDFMLGFLSRIERGCLTIDMPDGTIHRLGTPEPGLEATMRIGNYDFFLRLVKDGDVALGEGYTAGEYTCDDITTMLRIFIENRSRLEDKRLFTTWLGRFVNRVRHLARSNNLTGSRRNIRDHYDLGDRLFTRFLDPSMTYSCAVFDHPDQGLEEAQANKRRMLIRKARLGPNDHLLEIGCGWGALAIDAVRQTGCRVTGITLSDDQLRIARERVRAAGLEDRIDLRLCDYRTLEGQFDRIISVEMLEAVGHENLGDFFASCDRLLAPNGFVVLQVITTPDDNYEVYRRHCDWIQKVIFPGSLCPAFSALTAAMARRSRFVVEHVENIGVHYAETLRRWRDAFNASWPVLANEGYDDRFRRTWEYYFCYCEAGFATRTLGDLQIVLTRPNNKLLEDLEIVR